MNRISALHVGFNTRPSALSEARPMFAATVLAPSPKPVKTAQPHRPFLPGRRDFLRLTGAAGIAALSLGFLYKVMVDPVSVPAASLEKIKRGTAHLKVQFDGPRGPQLASESSAFAIADNTGKVHLVSCGHSVEDFEMFKRMAPGAPAYFYTMDMEGVKPFKAPLKAFSPFAGHDLSVFTVPDDVGETLKKTGRVLGLESLAQNPVTEKNLVGKPIITSGYPENETLTNTTGRVKDISQDGTRTYTGEEKPFLERLNAGPVLHLTATLRSGISGGPLGNEDGRVIGVCFIGSGGNDGYAVPVNTLKAFLESNGIPVTQPNEARYTTLKAFRQKEAEAFVSHQKRLWMFRNLIHQTSPGYNSTLASQGLNLPLLTEFRENYKRFENFTRLHHLPLDNPALALDPGVQRKFRQYLKHNPLTLGELKIPQP